MRAPHHLNALRAFEAAARHLSFVSAAQELNVTPAAVSQLIRGLEDAYGVTLFHRSRSGPSRLELTAAAAQALAGLQQGFDMLARAVEGLRQGASPATVSVTLPPAFADKWLLGKIEDFQRRYPQFELTLETSGRLSDLAGERIDLGVRFGHGRWPGLTATLLIGDSFFPVCSPSLLAGAALVCAEDLQHQVLIHDRSMRDTPAFPTWNSWLKAAGHELGEVKGNLNINDSAASLQAAIAGSGVALGRSSLVKDDLASGRLVRPFGEAQSSPLAYFIVQVEKAPLSAAAQTFKEWLLDAVQVLKADD